MRKLVLASVKKKALFEENSYADDVEFSRALPSFVNTVYKAMYNIFKNFPYQGNDSERCVTVEVYYKDLINPSVDKRIFADILYAGSDVFCLAVLDNEDVCRIKVDKDTKIKKELESYLKTFASDELPVNVAVRVSTNPEPVIYQVGSDIWKRLPKDRQDDPSNDWMIN